MENDRPVFEIKEENRFHLNPLFLAAFRGKQPKFGPQGLVTYKRTYAREKEDGTTEEFWETAQRVVEGIWAIFKQYVTSAHNPWDEEEAQEKAQDMFQRLWVFKWIPPGRGLWFMGTRALELRGGTSLQNCGFISTQSIDRDFAEPFVTMMDFLMLGVGVGSDTRGAGKVIIRKPRMGGPHVVKDSREGWCAVVRRVLDAYARKGVLPSEIDVSQVRPRGIPLKTFGGTASGPQPLLELIGSIRTLLDDRIGDPITSTDIVDLMNYIGKCVVAGNIRRSSEMILGSPDDDEFLRLKDPTQLEELKEKFLQTVSPEEKETIQKQINEHPLISHRWAANLSIEASEIRDFSKYAAQTVKNGEPNYVFLDNIKSRGRRCDPHDDKDRFVMGLNPCGEQPLEDGELCCLVEINPNAHESLEDFLVTCKVAYQYAKGVTLIPTHRPQTNSVMTRNRRIGTSLMGIWQFYENRGMQECIRWWKAGYAEIHKWDRTYSHWLGVGESIRRTTVKPGGTVPLLIGVEGGMRIPNFLFGYRTIRMEENSYIVSACRKANYRVEKDLTTPMTAVVYFPASNQGMRTISDVSLWEQAALLTALQRYWSDNAVSNTLVFNDAEAKDVVKVLELYANQWKSVAFLPHREHLYEQAPYIPCTKEEHEQYSASLLPLDLSGAKHEVEPDKFCEGEACEIK